MVQLMGVSWIRLNPEDAGVLTRAPEPLELPVGATIVQGLLAAGIAQNTVHRLIKTRSVAVFGVYALDSTVLYEGDRIEILDKLLADPMESRSRRVAHKRKLGLAQFGKVERRSQKRSKI
ncbi:MAG: RnfH family protein [Limnobacter sp.]|nr:RnfH family protein [Limnobacter sp.]